MNLEERLNLGRPWDKHLDNRELDALVPWPAETSGEMSERSPAAARGPQQHADSCAKCGAKVWKYRELVNRLSTARAPKAAPPQANCPNLSGVDWREVAAGMWQESKAKQLIGHAALCAHCGPLLREGMSADAHRDEEVREGKKDSRPVLLSRWGSTRWLVPVMALVVMVGAFVAMPWSSRIQFSGPRFAEFAVNTHRQHAQGKLALDLRSGSQLALNQWLKANSPFSVALPVSLTEAGEERPYDLEGAQLVRVGAKTAAFIAYRVKMPKFQTAASSLMVTPDSVAVASGGTEVDFKKVSFHYATVEGYKVVTWSVHGLTYALVSEEGNNTQRSCMVCHSAMKDRDLSRTPAPLRLGEPSSQAVWQ
jgi:hypothetical protein